MLENTVENLRYLRRSTRGFERFEDRVIVGFFRSTQPAP